MHRGSQSGVGVLPPLGTPPLGTAPAARPRWVLPAMGSTWRAILGWAVRHIRTGYMPHYVVHTRAM